MTTQAEIRRSVAAWAADTLREMAPEGAIDEAVSLDLSLLDPTDENERLAMRLAARWETEAKRLIAELVRRAERPLPARKKVRL